MSAPPFPDAPPRTDTAVPAAALLYVLLKEGYALKVARPRPGRPPKCVAVDGPAEAVPRDGLLALGREFEAIVRARARAPGPVDVAPRDLFDDGAGAAVAAK